MVIREYPNNMSCKKLVMWKSQVIYKDAGPSAGIKRISLYPWPGGYCTCVFEFDWSLCKIDRLR